MQFDPLQLFKLGRSVDEGDLRAGDLVFFASNKTNPATIYHVGLYIGGGQMIEAPFTGENVRISSIYRASLFGAGRPPPVAPPRRASAPLLDR